MNIRKKVILTLLVLTFLIFGYFSHYLFRFSNSKFNEIEAQSVAENIARTERTIVNIVESINVANWDWSSWDDTYFFMDDLNQRYIESNIVNTTFTDLRLNYMMFFDQEAQIAYSRGYDLEKNEFMEVSGELESIIVDQGYLNHPTVQSEHKGFIDLDGLPVMVSSTPITRSDGNGPIKGALVMARIVTQEETDHIRELTQLHVELNTACSAVDPAVMIQFQVDEMNDTISIDQSNPNYVTSHFCKTDSQGNSVLLVTIRTPRVFAEYKTDFYWAVGFSGFSVFLIYLVVITVFLDTFLMRRILRLIDQVSDIGEKRDFTMQVSQEGNDEISNLGKNINTMLNELAKTKDLEQENIELLELDQVKNHFISVAAHEIRTPLTSILGYLEISEPLLEKAPEELRLYQSVIKRNTERLAIISDDLLDQQRINSGSLLISFTKCDLGQILNECIDEQHAYLDPKQIQLNLDISQDLPCVEADPIRISQVLVNIIHNAIKYSKTDGTIHLSLQQEDNNIKFTCRDNGSGVAKENLPLLFTPFPEIPKSVDLPSIGLGLSICKGIIDKHNGTLTAHSDGLGTGLTVTFTIPITQTQ